MRIYPHLEGRRCLIDLRCSTPYQAGTSIPDQQTGADAFTKANKLIPVGVITQEGVTGSVPAVRTDIDEVIERKRTLNDFDVLVVTDISRFTRAGLKHGMKWEYELEVEGIEIVFVANDLPTGEDGDLVKPAYYFAARMWAKSLAYCCTRGSMSALLDGRMAHCTRAPYGLDFLYLVGDKPSHLTRIMPDGSQLKLDPLAMGSKPTEKQILMTFPPNPKKGTIDHKRRVSYHYRKQKNERVVLAPGDPDAIATVHMIFWLKLVKGWGGGRIAMELNGLGIPAPSGGLWNTSTVDQILRNKTYVGMGLANRKTRAIINKRSAGTPTPRNVSPRDLAKRKTQALEFRPKDDWVERPYDLLENFLGPELAPLAKKFIEKELKKTENGRVPKKEFHDRHANSTFILKNILRSKQGGHPMTGFVSYSNGHIYRRYRISKAAHAPVKGSILNRKVPADKSELAVKKMLEQVLSQVPDLRRRLAAAVKKEIARRMKDNVERKRLIAERDACREEYRILITNVGKHGRDLAKQRFAQLEAQIDSLDARIEAADAIAGAKVKPEQQADQIIEELEKFHAKFADMPPAQIASALKVLISRLEVDLETLEFDVEIALPSWAMINVENFRRQLCLVPNSHTRTGSQAQWIPALILGTFHCDAEGRPVCFTCRRMRKAA